MRYALPPRRNQNGRRSKPSEPECRQRAEPERASTPRSQESNGVPSTPVGRDERKRQILLALAVVVLVVLSFLAGRL